MVDLGVSSVCERDIDLLLLEEFISSPEFCGWFCELVTQLGDQFVEVVSAQRSVTQSIGESDLEVSVSLKDGSTHYLLIENKIGAGFQPRQPSRYRERGENYRNHGECSSFTTVLIAPNAYLGTKKDTKGFEFCVSYEEIQSWLADKMGNSHRGLYKQYMFSRAIDKATLGYQPGQDDHVTNFWRSYWEIATEIAPELEMAEPLTKPAGAGFVWFKPGFLPPGISITHKLPYGNVDLQFSGLGKQLATLRNKVGAYLEDDMTIARANKSGAVRLKVPQLDTAADFDEQKDQVKTGIESARRLLDWYLANIH